MSGIRRVSDLGTQGVKTILDGSVQTADIANNAITQAKLDTSIPLSGMRNAIINGDFSIWQRTNSSEYTPTISTPSWQAPDRWWSAQISTASTLIISRQTADTSFLQYGCRVQRKLNQTNTGAIYFGQTLESSMSKRFAGQQVTISFYAKKGANSPSTFNIVVYSGTGSDQSTGSLFSSGWTGGTSIIDQTVSPTTTMTRYSYTFSVSSNINQIGVWFKWTPIGTAQADDWFQFEGVQLEIGSQPTPFEQRPFGVELALCQRYYWKWVSANNGDLFVGVFQPASTNFFHLIPMPVKMRARPTSATVSGSWTVINSSASPSVYDRGDSWMILQSTVNAAIGNTNQSGFFSSNALSVLVQDAEL